LALELERVLALVPVLGPERRALERRRASEPALGLEPVLGPEPQASEPALQRRASE
jgi:hypothetical protein